jgi:acetylornithine/succinyldiaminopimelate/putrescine aminotransferase
MGSEYFKQAYRPLLPGIRQLRYNEMDDLNQIDETVACVVAETIQAEAGVVVPSREWINALRERCNSTGTLLVLDEIQCGFGRNGTLWAFQQFGIVPDILLLGKALGGGMPLGAFIADKKMMQVLSHNPVLGHITTFGGHPVCCAAGAAALEVLTRDNLVREVAEKEKLFLKHLAHPKIKRITHKGLMLAVWMEDFETNKKLLTALLKEGVFSDWFLFAPEAMRIVPPLTITAEEIENSCSVIRKVLDTL